MSKWSEEFIGMFEDTGRIRKLTEEYKKGQREDREKVKKVIRRYEKNDR